MDWQPNKYQQLLLLLNNSQKSEFNQDYLSIEAIKDSLSELKFPLNFEVENELSKQKVLQGFVYQDGEQKVIAPEIIPKVIQLSEELRIDSNLAANILSYAYREEDSKEDKISLAKKCFYKERAYQLACLEYILNNAQFKNNHPKRELFETILNEIWGSQNDMHGIKYLLQLLKEEYEIINLDYCAEEYTVHDQQIIEYIYKEKQTICRILHLLLVQFTPFIQSYEILITFLSKYTDPDVVFVHLFVTILTCLKDEITSTHIPDDNEIELAFSLHTILKSFVWILDEAREFLFCYLGLYFKKLHNTIEDINKFPTGFQFEKLNQEIDECLQHQIFHFITLNFFSPIEISNAISQFPKINNDSTHFRFDPKEFNNLSKGKVEFPFQSLTLDPFEPEFKVCLLECLDLFVSTFPGTFLDNLMIHFVEEDDQLFYIPNSDELVLNHAILNNQNFYKRKHHKQITYYFISEGFYNLVTLVYNNHSNSSYDFIFKYQSCFEDYLRLSLKHRSLRLRIAFQDSLIAMANNQSSSDYIFNKFNSHITTNGIKLNNNIEYKTGLNWIYLIKNIEEYTKLLLDSYQNKTNELSNLNQNQIEARNLSTKSDIRMLSSLIATSPLARNSILSSDGTHIIKVFMDILSQPYEPSIKSLIFDIFSSLTNSIITKEQEYENLFYIWDIIESMQIIPYDNHNKLNLPFSDQLNNIKQDKLAELPEIQSLSNLINQLIKIKEIQNKQFTLSISTSQSIPYELGFNYRQPGIKHYIKFITNNIFSQIFNYNFKYDYDGWNILSNTSHIILKCLTLFKNLSLVYNNKDHFEMVANYIFDDKAKIQSQIDFLILHPGFDLIIDIFQGGIIIDNLFKILIQGYQQLIYYPKNLFPAIHQTILFTLQILNLVIELQPFVFDILLPEALSKSNYKQQIIYPSSLKGFNSILLLKDTKTFLFNLLNYISYNEDQQIPYYTIQLINYMLNEDNNISKNNNNTSYYQRYKSNNNNPILNAIWDPQQFEKFNLIYFNKLNELPLPQPIININNKFSKKLIQPKIDYYFILRTIFQSIINSLLKGDHINFAHFLLGYQKSWNSKNHYTVLLPKLNSNTVLSFILELLDSYLFIFMDNKVNFNTPNIYKVLRIDVDSSIISLGYEIISKLCSDNLTSINTIKSLINNKDFINRHSDLLTVFQTKVINADSFISYSDKLKVQIDANQALNKLTSQYHILNVIYQQLSKYSIETTFDDVASFIGNFFGVKSEIINLDNTTYSSEELNIPNTTCLKSLFLLLGKIEVFAQGNLINNNDAVNVGLKKLIDGINLSNYFSGDKDNLETYDLNTLKLLIEVYKADRFIIDFNSDLVWFEQSQQKFLEYFTNINKVANYRIINQKAIIQWCDLIELCITKHFNVINYDNQEIILLEVLLFLLDKLIDNHLNQSIINRFIMLINHIIIKLYKEFQYPKSNDNLLINSTIKNMPYFLTSITNIWNHLARFINLDHSVKLRVFNYQSLAYFLAYIKSFKSIIKIHNGNDNNNLLFIDDLQQNNLLNKIYSDIIFNHNNEDDQLNTSAMELLLFLVDYYDAGDIVNLNNNNNVIEILISKGILNQLLSSLKLDIKFILNQSLKVSLKYFNCKIQLLKMIFQKVDVSETNDLNVLLSIFEELNIFEYQLNPNAIDLDGNISQSFDLSYKLTTPLLQLLSSALRSTKNNLVGLAVKVSKLICSNSAFFLSILNTPENNLNLYALYLMQEVLDILLWFFEHDDILDYKDIKIFDVYHLEILSILKYFYNKELWLSKVKYIRVDPKEVKDLRTIQIYNEKVESNVASILATVLKYLSNVYGSGYNLAPISSPIALNASLEVSNTLNNTNLIRFYKLPSIGDMLNLIEQYHTNLMSLVEKVHMLDSFIKDPKLVNKQFILQRVDITYFDWINQFNLPHLQARAANQFIKDKQDSEHELVSVTSILSYSFTLLIIHLSDFIDVKSPFFINKQEGINMNAKQYIEHISKKLTPVCKSIDNFSMEVRTILNEAHDTSSVNLFRFNKALIKYLDGLKSSSV